jgi:hypothetical protein
VAVPAGIGNDSARTSGSLDPALHNDLEAVQSCAMPDIDPTVEMQARQVIRGFSIGRGCSRAETVSTSYPTHVRVIRRSENTFPFCKAVVLVCLDLLKTCTALPYHSSGRTHSDVPPELPGGPHRLPSRAENANP